MPSETPQKFRRLLSRAVFVPPVLLGLLSLVFLIQILYLLSAARWVDHTDKVIAEANVLLRMLIDRESWMRGYLVLGNGVFLDLYEGEEQNIHPVFAALSDRVSDNTVQVERLQALRVAHLEWQAFARTLIALRKAGKDHLPLARTLEGKTRMDAIRVQVAEFIQMEEELREKRTSTVRQGTWIVVATSLGLAMLLGGGLAAYSRRRLLDVSAIYTGALTEVENQAASLRTSASRLETLHAIDQAILASVPFPELTRAALGRLEMVIPSRESFVVVFDPMKPPAAVICRDSSNMTRVDADAGQLEGENPVMIPDLGSAAGLTPIQQRLLQSGNRSYLSLPLSDHGTRFGLMLLADPGTSVFSEEHRQIATEVSQQLAIAFLQEFQRERLNRNAEELEEQVRTRTSELQASLERVKQLRGLLPICAWCKKVRDDQNYWHEVEHYVANHTDAKFTHGMCPDCFQKNL